jgi:hypothetical protein
MGARAVDETDHRATEPAAIIPGVWLLTRIVVPSPTTRTTRTKTWVMPKDTGATTDLPVSSSTSRKATRLLARRQGQ